MQLNKYFKNAVFGFAMICTVTLPTIAGAQDPAITIRILIGAQTSEFDLADLRDGLAENDLVADIQREDSLGECVQVSISGHPTIAFGVADLQDGAIPYEIVDLINGEDAYSSRPTCTEALSLT